MFDRWRDLDPSQRRVLGVLGSLVVAVALVVGVVTLSGSDTRVALRADQSSSSSTSTSAATVSSQPGDAATSTSTSTAGSSSGAGAGATTVPRDTATTPASGPGGTRNAAPGRAGSTGTAAATAVPTPTTPPTATTSAAACNPGGGGPDANTIANLFCQYRSDHGLAKMTRNSALDQVAQAWAQKMADAAASGADPRTKALQHNTTDVVPPYSGPTYPGGYPAAVRADCRRCTGWAENVAYNTTAADAWSEWLKSSGHLANISDGHAGEYGIGVASGGGFLWFVQDFGRYPS